MNQCTKFAGNPMCFLVFPCTSGKVLANVFKPSNISLTTTENSNLQQQKHQTLSQLQNPVILLRISFLTHLPVTSTGYAPPFSLLTTFKPSLVSTAPTWTRICLMEHKHYHEINLI